MKDKSVNECSVTVSDHFGEVAIKSTAIESKLNLQEALEYAVRFRMFKQAVDDWELADLLGGISMRNTKQKLSNLGLRGNNLKEICDALGVNIAEVKSHALTLLGKSKD